MASDLIAVMMPIRDEVTCSAQGCKPVLVAGLSVVSFDATVLRGLPAGSADAGYRSAWFRAISARSERRAPCRGGQLVPDRVAGWDKIITWVLGGKLVSP